MIPLTSHEWAEDPSQDTDFALPELPPNELWFQEVLHAPDDFDWRQERYFIPCLDEDYGLALRTIADSFDEYSLPAILCYGYTTLDADSLYDALMTFADSHILAMGYADFERLDASGEGTWLHR